MIIHILDTQSACGVGTTSSQCSITRLWFSAPCQTFVCWCSKSSWLSCQWIYLESHSLHHCTVYLSLKCEDHLALMCFLFINKDTFILQLLLPGTPLQLVFCMIKANSYHRRTHKNVHLCNAAHLPLPIISLCLCLSLSQELCCS